MDPKRKKIYTILIVVCLLGSAGIWYWGIKGGSPVIEETPVVNTPPSSATVSGGLNSSRNEFPAPAVFPSSTKFNFGVLDSAKYKSLKSTDPLIRNPEEYSRDNPFTKY